MPGRKAWHFLFLGSGEPAFKRRACPGRRPSRAAECPGNRGFPGSRWLRASTKSACLPFSSEPTSLPRFRLQAALMVAAVMVSAGVIFIWVQAEREHDGHGCDGRRAGIEVRCQYDGKSGADHLPRRMGSAWIRSSIRNRAAEQAVSRAAERAAIEGHLYTPGDQQWWRPGSRPASRPGAAELVGMDTQAKPRRQAASRIGRRTADRRYAAHRRHHRSLPAFPCNKGKHLSITSST